MWLILDIVAKGTSNPGIRSFNTILAEDLEGILASRSNSTTKICESECTLSFYTKPVLRGTIGNNYYELGIDSQVIHASLTYIVLHAHQVHFAEFTARHPS